MGSGCGRLPTRSSASLQREVEGGAVAGRALDPDPPAVLVDDLLADREPDARARVAIGAVQAVERAEDDLGLVRIQADAVVADGDHRHVAVTAGEHLDPRVGVARELDRVGEQVLQQLDEPGRVAHHGRQRLHPHVGVGVGDRARQALERLANERVELDRLRLDGPPLEAGVREQLADQAPHARGAVADVDGQLARLGVLVEALGEHLRVHPDRHQRALEVVRGDRGVVLELAVGALEVLGAVGQLHAAALQRGRHRVERPRRDRRSRPAGRRGRAC